MPLASWEALGFLGNRDSNMGPISDPGNNAEILKPWGFNNEANNLVKGFSDTEMLTYGLTLDSGTSFQNTSS